MSRIRISGLALFLSLFVLGLVLQRGWGVREATAQQDSKTVSIRTQGVDHTGNFQAALDDALAQADAYFAGQGADISYTYDVLKTQGVRGGFVATNDIFVTILAR